MFDSNYEEFPGVFYIYVGYWREYVVDDQSGKYIPYFLIWFL
ncbi:hypothetical protein ERIN107935_06820 [Erysipelothrix inopinata]|nr:hypothetical protein [Erysipelothrix inopinata]